MNETEREHEKTEGWEGGEWDRKSSRDGWVLSHMDVKGIVHPELKFHSFSTHRYVDVD